MQWREGLLLTYKNSVPYTSAESLILSKIDYNDIVTYPIHEYLLKRLQRVQFAAAGFVCRKFADMRDILKLGWLPIVERQEYHIAKTAYQAATSRLWPKHLKLEQYVPPRTLRSSGEFSLVLSRITGSFRHYAPKVFNALPATVRASNDRWQFSRMCKAHFVSRTADRLTDY